MTVRRYVNIEGKKHMATERKIFKKAVKRSASGTPVNSEQVIDHVLQAAVEWSNDHEFISPHEIYVNSIGLLFCLTTRRLINISFTNLYRRSLKITWADLLNRERRILKSNINSVAKCFLINRMIAECLKDPCEFARQTGELYEEIKMRMSSKIPSNWTVEDFYGQILSIQNLQCQRRLFHIDHDEINQPQSLLTLQRFATTLYSQFLKSCQINPTTENYNHLKNLLHHSFIIVAQPSIPECVAATKYEKLNNTYLAKLSTRIICLLDPDTIEKSCILSNVDVTLYLFDRNLDPYGEDQTALVWHKRAILDAEEVLKTLSYVELESVELKKLDPRNTRPLYSAKLCQLQFQLNIKIHEINREENLKLFSQLFGICSHARFYPEFVAKVLLHEVTQMPQTSSSIIQPNILTNYIHRYHTRISGVEVKQHTFQYITDVLQTAYERKQENPNFTSFEIYEDILAKLISQMEMYIDYPFLSVMYHDGLFLGICNSTFDQQLSGTREQPHILLRFNSLLTHIRTKHPSVRFIVHNGQLIKATFHTKVFIDEMCRMICEAKSERAKQMQFLSETPNRNFHEFCLYFDNELYRLDSAVSPMNDAYKPLIPVLWNTMRINTDEQTEQQLYSPPLDLELIPEDLSPTNSSSIDEIQIDLSNIIEPTNFAGISNEKVIIQTEILVHHLVEKLSDLLAKSPTTENVSPTSVNIAKASALLSNLTNGDIQQQKDLLFRLLLDSFQTKSHIDVATQTSSSGSSNSPANTTEDT